MAIQGSLRNVSIPELFSLLLQMQKTGVLSLVSEIDERGFLFYHGNLLYATSKDTSRRLGHFLARLGYLSAAELEKEFASPPPSEGYQGHQLVERGVVTSRQLKNAVKAQILDILKEVMRWKDGAFLFDDEELPFEIPDQKLIRTQSVLLEASRMADEDLFADRLFPERNVVFSQNKEKLDQAASRELDANETAILDLVDGERSVEQILFQGPQGIRVSAEALHGLREAGRIRQTSVQVFESPDTAPELMGSLPVAPDVPVRILWTFRPGAREAEEQHRGVCELLSAEPILTAKVLKMLNLRNTEVRRSQMSIEHLVQLTGVFHLRCSLLPEAARGIYLAPPLHRWRDWWEYCQLAAHLSEQLAVSTGYLFPGEAFLAGLLHRFGVFLLLHKDPAMYQQTVADSLFESRDLLFVEEERFGIHHTRIGAIHAEKWNFPRMLVLAIKHHRYSLNAVPANPLLHVLNTANGLLRKNGCVLGYEHEAQERFETSLEYLGIDAEEADLMYQEARRRASCPYRPRVSVGA